MILLESVSVVKLGVDSLRITGCVTLICVLFIIAGAVLRDYAITVVEDGVAGLAKEDPDAAMPHSGSLRTFGGELRVKSGTDTESRKAA